jgi:hypothetical protein
MVGLLEPLLPKEKIAVMKTPLLFKAKALKKVEKEEVMSLIEGHASSRLPFHRLKVGKWLNDELINAFYILLGIRSIMCGQNDLFLSKLPLLIKSPKML